MAIGKRLRFEILKRDGFRCKYCGANSIEIAMEVDHVVPKSKGGTDDSANLITACYSCNRGKSSTPLDESKLPDADPIEKPKEQVEQVSAYLAAQKEAESKRQEVVNYLKNKWETLTGDIADDSLLTRFSILVRQHQLDRIVEAIEIVGAKFDGDASYGSWNKRIRYLYGVLRKMDEERPR